MLFPLIGLSACVLTMVGNNLFLQRAVFVGESSVFFLPKEGVSLDFQTISDAPKTHRAFLQKNGLVAKVILSLSAASNQNLTPTRAERLKIWSKVLHSCVVAEADIKSATAPDALSDAEWPILDADLFAERMETALRLSEEEELKQCPFLVPVLSVQRLVHSDAEMTASLGIIWMPFYGRSLPRWCEGGRHIPEATLWRLAGHLTAALLALRASRLGGVSCLSAEDILLGEESDAGPVFVLAAAGSQLRPPRNTSQRPIDAFSSVPPEALSPAANPLGDAKCDVWSVGRILHQIACGVPTTGGDAARLRCYNIKKRLELPLNHPSLTPSDVARRVRRDFQSRSYSNIFIHLVVLMLSQDPLTRPTPFLLNQMLHELCCHRPFVHFPFAVGCIDLVRVQNPENVLLIPTKRKYILNAPRLQTQETYVDAMCVSMRQEFAVCSPFWSNDELLPGYTASRQSRMTYLFPALSKLGSKEERQYIGSALKTKSMDQNTLLRVLGGFAVITVEEGDVVTREVFFPIPHNVLYKEEMQTVAVRLSFTAALPWPSHCTAQLQENGRIQRGVPAVFGMHKALWYTWILPGESFELNGSEWIPAINGAFVFWFNENLRPSELDRYFLVCDLPSAISNTSVECTVIPDKCFDRRRSSEDIFGFGHSKRSRVKNGSKDQERQRLLPSALGGTVIEPRSNNVPSVEVSIESEVAAADTKTSPTQAHGSFEDEDDGEKEKKTVVGALRAAHLPSASLFSRRRRPSLSKRAAVQMEYVETIGLNMHEKSRMASPIEPLCLPALKATTTPLSMEDAASTFETQKLNYKKNKRINRQLSEMVRNGSGKFYEVARLKMRRHAISKHSLTPCADLPAVHPSIVKSENYGAQAKLSLHVFGRWYSPRWVEAAFESLTFCVPETGEHGRLSAPVKLTAAVRRATQAPPKAVHVAFCSSDVPLVRRNHQHCAMALPPAEIKDIIPHHAFVFYDHCREVVGLLALRFAATGQMKPAFGEIFLDCKMMPPVSAAATFAGQINAAYFSGNVRCAPTSSSGNAASRNSDKPLSPLQTDENVDGSVVSVDACQELTLSGAELMSFAAPCPRVKRDREGVLSACWVGFDTATGMMMFSDMRRETWHPVYFCSDVVAE